VIVYSIFTFNTIPNVPKQRGFLTNRGISNKVTKKRGDSGMLTAKVTYVNGLQFVGEGSSHHAIVLDGDSSAGGHNSGLQPMELLLIGIGGCSGMDVISILKKKRQDVTGLEINVNGGQAADYPKKFDTITVEFVVKGKNISEEAVKRAIDLSMDKYCSVKATLEDPTTITSSYRITEE
jgi:putative redox protein